MPPLTLRRCAGLFSGEGWKKTCSNGKKNLLESDVDCGGPHCPPCGPDQVRFSCRGDETPASLLEGWGSHPDRRVAPRLGLWQGWLRCCHVRLQACRDDKDCQRGLICDRGLCTPLPVMQPLLLPAA